MSSSGTAQPITSAPATTPVRQGAYTQLALATLGFGVCFWAWALIGPLGTAYKKLFELSSGQQALLVAVPVIVGSLGRIPVGALTDRYGARIMFPAVSFLTIAPVLFIGQFGTTYSRLLVAGFFLGIGGTSFAVGVPHVNSWFPPAHRGTAIGIFGIGMGGTAVSAFTTVKLVDAHGRSFPFFLVAGALLVYGLLAVLFIRDAAKPGPMKSSFLARTASVLRLKVTWQLSFLYAVGFGGFVAFSVYLPTYLKNDFSLTQVDAASRTAGFVVVAVLARPVGGWLSDRFHPAPVLTVCFAVVAAFAAVASLRQDLVPVGTVAFLGMAAALGAAAGAVFALVAEAAPQDKVGGVTGLVGAAGGLGGFVPPLVMGAVYGRTGNYVLGFVLLALTAAAASVYAWTAMRRTDTNA